MREKEEEEELIKLKYKKNAIKVFLWKNISNKSRNMCVVRK